MLRNFPAFSNELRNYINKKNLSAARKEQFEKISPETLEVWLRAANIASLLEEGIGFDATAAQDITMMTDTGLRIASKALVKIDNLVSYHSDYADAVQQFLHVRLNQERQQEKNAGTGKKISKTPYYIEPLSQIIFTSTASTLLNAYPRRIGMTGSSGAITERMEMDARYRMKFIDVPDPQPSNRVDLMPHVVSTPTKKIKVLKEYQQDALEESRPHLVLRKNDNESKEFFDSMPPRSDQTVQRLEGTLSGYDKKIIQAGKPKTTTIATNILRRGVDINLSPEGNLSKGLSLIAES